MGVIHRRQSVGTIRIEFDAVVFTIAVRDDNCAFESSHIAIRNVELSGGRSWHVER